MTNEARKRKVNYEDNNWDKYQGIMERNGFTLVFKPEVKNQVKPYHNLMMGDGIWINKNSFQTFRDLKTCGRDYGAAISENSMKNFPINGVYDFYDFYFTHTVYSMIKSELLYYYNYHKECWKQDGDLVRFNFNFIEKYGEKFV